MSFRALQSLAQADLHIGLPGYEALNVALDTGLRRYDVYAVSCRISG
jgi:hypothetical protein